jgi:uncharacterized membrane protein YoaK (UPF0700 family)
MADAVSFPDYHCFTSNQTGNTIFLTLALILPELDGEMFILSNVGVALTFFLAAACLTGQLSHYVGPRRRYWLMICNFLQSCLVLAAAIVQYRQGIQLEGSSTLVIIALLALASGSQVVQSRSLGVPEISTAMATAAWVDSVIDPNLVSTSNRTRSRRAGFLLVLVLGALFGGFLYRFVGSAAALAVSAAGKFLVTGMYFFNGREANGGSTSDEKV